MTTKQAFEKLFDNPELVSKLKLNASTVRSFRKRIQDKEKISLDKMEELLKKAGFKKKPEQWTLR